VPAVSSLVAAMLVSAAVTWALRALPFAILALLRSRALVHYLGTHMPAGVMTVLVVYTVTALPGPRAALAVALAATVGLHLWRRNLALSMLAGTIVYVVLVSLVS